MLRPEHRRLLDVACGTGLISKLLHKVMQSPGRADASGTERLMVGLDLSPAAMRIFEQDADAIGVRLLQGAAENVPLQSGSFDLVFLGNAIHNVHDKDGLIREAARVLRKGGIFVFNTAFFEGTIPPKTFAFYRAAAFKGLRLLKRYPDVKIRKQDRAEARQSLTPEAYREMVTGRGFKVIYMELERIDLPLEAAIDIGSFADFASGALPGVPLDVATEIIRQAIVETWREHGQTSLPRNWLHVICERL